MASERQVACWIAECLKTNLKPDALWVECFRNVVRVVTRQPGTKEDRGPTYVVVVRIEEPSVEPAAAPSAAPGTATEGSARGER